MAILIKYSVFAIIAIFTNISTQYAFLSIWLHPYSLYAGIFVGTITGFTIKYILDRIYIFSYREKSIKQNTVNLLLYAFTSIFTTIIFWATELLFNFVFNFNFAKYLGAIIGLSIGYLIKYQLDKTYVFSKTG